MSGVLRFLCVMGAAMGLVSCAQLRPPDTAVRGPVLELEKFFAGRTRSWGMVEDPFGKVRQTFTADLRGEQRDGFFYLDQRFRFADGTTERREWQIRRVGHERYEATATGIQGVAEGRIAGGAVHLRYNLTTKVGKGATKVRFDQWLWREGEEVLLNRVDVRKFGIRVARVAEVFRKG